MTEVLEIETGTVPPVEAKAVLAKVRTYFKSRFAMWDSCSTNWELFMFSCARTHYPKELTAQDCKSVQAEFKLWSDGGPLPRHVLDWYKTALDDIMHFPR